GLVPVGFSDVPSRRLRADLERAAAELDRVIARCAVDALWVPAFEGGHQDHDAANALAASFAGRRPVWEFAGYNFAGGRIRAVPLVPVAHSEGRLRRLGRGVPRYRELGGSREAAAGGGARRSPRRRPRATRSRIRAPV